ncbi:MAG TPA: hypothetical protein V6D33_10160 [Cyanophyceae cyanobacterium]
MNKDTIRDTAILTAVGLSVATTAYVAVSAIANNTPPLQPNQPLPILITNN